MEKKQKLKKPKGDQSILFYIILAAFFIGLIFLIMVGTPNLIPDFIKQKPTAKVIPGDTLQEALFLNQCEFYNFVLKANKDPRRFNCPEEDK